MAEARILIAEDEAIVAKDIEISLRRLGYEVVASVDSCAAVIEQSKLRSPDLVLMDVLLKGDGDGIDAAVRIRESSDIPVVYLTAYADEATVERAKRTEPFGYLLKPFTTRELASSVEIALYKARMERRLRAHERWLDTTLRSIGDAVVATDTSGAVLFMNPVAEALTGWLEADARGVNVGNVLRLLDEAQRAPLENPVASVIDRGQVCHLDHRRALLVARDGREIPVEDNVAPVRDGAGHVTGAVICFRDASERREVEQRLRNFAGQLEKLVEERTASLVVAKLALEREIEERQQAESLLRETEKLAATGRMAARVAHEINNPLAGIKNSFRLLKDAVPRDHVYFDYIARVDQEIDRIAQIVRQMFDLYRQDTEPTSSVNAAETVREVTGLLASQARAHRVTFKWSSQVTSLVSLPERLLRQVLFNVLLNAIEASPEGGIVTINMEIAKAALVLTVADQGAGIPAHIGSRVFEAFFTTKSQQRSLGLGLSTSKSIMTALGGELEFASSADGGTVFRMVFPTKESRAEVRL